MLSDGLKNNIYIIKVHNVTERGLRGKYEATRASILLLFGMKVRGLCKRTVCTKIEVACEDLCVFACVSVVSAWRVRGKHAASRGSPVTLICASLGTPFSPSWDANERP